MANKTLVQLIGLPRERGNDDKENDRSTVRLLVRVVEVLNRCVA